MCCVFYWVYVVIVVVVVIAFIKYQVQLVELHIACQFKTVVENVHVRAIEHARVGKFNVHANVLLSRCFYADLITIKICLLRKFVGNMSRLASVMRVSSPVQKLFGKKARETIMCIVLFLSSIFLIGIKLKSQQ